MRLIAELESKQAILQEQVVNMTAEVQMLQEETMRIGKCILKPSSCLVT